VGKGVCFDTGGISIKPAAGMEDMKWDMGGAGAVAGLMLALAGRRAKANVVGVCGLVENMPDGLAQRPGDVITSASGQTVEVINTDAEGRLVLADSIWWAQREYQPETLIDLATLTGAIIVTLGHEHAGLFSNTDALADSLLAAGKATGETLWRQPLSEKGGAYDKLTDSAIAGWRRGRTAPGTGCCWWRRPRCWRNWTTGCGRSPRTGSCRMGATTRRTSRCCFPKGLRGRMARRC
jgi:leucyl aminopeptidase